MDSNIQIQTIGGVSSYNVESPNNYQPTVVVPQVQSVGAVHSVGTNGSSSSDVQFMASDALQSGPGLFATARNGFFPAQGNITPDTTVVYQGMEISVAQLESLGVVRKGNNGNYEEAPVSNQPQTTQQQPQLPEGVELFSQGVESQVADAIDPIPQELYDASISQAISVGLDSINFNELAYHSGLTPDEARDRAEVVLNAYSNQADTIAKSLGVGTPQEAWDWMESKRPSDFERAKLEMAFGRNTSALRQLIGEYVKEVPPSVQSLQQANIPLTKNDKGEDLAFLNGMWVEVQSAAQARMFR